MEPSGVSINNVTIKPINDRTYYGTNITPNLDLIYEYDNNNGEPEFQLIKDKDYTVEYSNNLNAGTAKAKITGLNNFKGTKTVTFNIKPADVSNATITLSSTSYTYSGTAKKPTATVKIGNTTLEKNTDYTVSYSNNTNAGTATVTITGKGNYTGSKTATFTITAKSISGATVTLSPTSYTYDGTAKKPTETVKIGDVTLTKGTDYTVTYSNNTSVGTGKVTITGKGNYTGSKTATFTITAQSISGATVTLSSTSYTYNGNAKKPTATVKIGDVTLTKGTDYTVEYINNTNVGTATVTITGKGNYTGSKTTTFTITAKSVSGTTVTLSPTSYTYDGTAKTPTETVKLGDVALTKGTDYTVTYSNNTNVGTGKVTIAGKGNYTGSKTATFAINGIDISSATITLNTTSYVYNGSAKKPTATVKLGNTTLVKDTDYTVSYSNNTNVGTATVTITGKGIYAGSKTTTFTITAKSVSGTTVTLSPTSYTYDGTAKTPTETVKLGDITLIKETDYTITYSNNTSVGTGKVTIAGKGNYTGSKTETFTITAKNISEATVNLNPTSYTYDGTEKKPTATIKIGNTTLVKDTDYTVAYSNNTNAGTATVLITGKGNYTGSKTTTFAITAKGISGATITLNPTSYTYDGTAKTPTETVKLGDVILTKDTDYTVVYSNNTNVGEGKVTITGKGNYSGSKTATFAITAQSISGATVNLNQTLYTYDGTAKTPTPTVKIGDTTLIKDTDYTVVYSNNTNVGEGKVTITGKGNYTGSKEVIFTINKKEIVGATITLNPTLYTYDKTEKQPEVTVKDGDTTLVKDTDYTVTYSNNIDAGEGIVTITGKGNYNGSKEVIFTINKKEIVGVTVTINPTSYTYDGTEKQPEVTAKDGNTTLVKDTDYIVEYSNNIDAGEGIVTIVGKGNYTGNKEERFNIQKQNPEYIVPTGIVTIIDKKAMDISLPEGFTWENPEFVFDQVGIVELLCTYTPKDTKNNNVITGIKVSVRVNDKINVNIKHYTTQEDAEKNCIYICGIEEMQKIQDFTKNIETNGTITIYEKDGTEIKDGNCIVKTGTVIKINTELEKIEYKLVVMGDNNGDGKCDSIDLLKTARYLTELDNDLTGEFLLACDVIPGNGINNADLLKMARYICGLE